jgi:hypothetical protein
MKKKLQWEKNYLYLCIQLTIDDMIFLNKYNTKEINKTAEPEKPTYNRVGEIKKQYSYVDKSF